MKEDLENFVKKLREYENSLSLTINIIDDIELLLNVRPDDLRRKSPDDLQYISLLLVQYSLYIQTELNRQLAVRDWCKDKINAKVASISKRYDNYTKYEIIYYTAINEDEEAYYLNEMYNIASSRIYSLTGIVNKVEHLSKIIESISYTKRR